MMRSTFSTTTMASWWMMPSWWWRTWNASWRKTFFGHDAFHVLHHHDGIIHHDADGQHHGKQRQGVDRVADGIQTHQPADQRDRHDDGGNEGGAQVSQEQI